MFLAFLAHHQEILYFLVSRYGKRKYGRELWCPVVSLVWSVFPLFQSLPSDNAMDTYVLLDDAQNHEPKIHGIFYVTVKQASIVSSQIRACRLFMITLGTSFSAV
jgi:hypothetical protein